MAHNTHEDKYSGLIADIKRKRNLVIILTIIGAIVLVTLTSPIQLEVVGEVLIDYRGVHPAITVGLVLLCMFIEIIAYAAVSAPLTSAMDTECDPEKQLILNTALSKPGSVDHVFTVDYLYLGDYPKALPYAEKMIASGKTPSLLAGLFHKARCEFGMGNYEGLRDTEKRYAATLSSTKIHPKAMPAYLQMHAILLLLCALAENDTEKIRVLGEQIMPWNCAKPTQGYVNYLKGLAAFRTGNKEEAIYRLTAVKDICPKTVFAMLAEEHLLSLG